MFGHRYFGARYFGPRYWGDGGDAAPEAVVARRITGKKREARDYGFPVYREPPKKKKPKKIVVKEALKVAHEATEKKESNDETYKKSIELLSLTKEIAQSASAIEAIRESLKRKVKAEEKRKREAQIKFLLDEQSRKEKIRAHVSRLLLKLEEEQREEEEFMMLLLLKEDYE